VLGQETHSRFSADLNANIRSHSIRGDEMPQFDAYEDLVGKWRWRLLGADGRTVATAGESYDSHWHALRAAEDVRGAACAAQICSIPASGVADALAEIIDRELAHS
jgi:uncharacterized protein YegP (UPF0339 family)